MCTVDSDVGRLDIGEYMCEYILGLWGCKMYCGSRDVRVVEVKGLSRCGRFG